MSNPFFNVEPFPLTWPQGWPRTPLPNYSRFSVTPAKATRELIAEVQRMGGRHLVISSNQPLRRDGLPLAVRTPIYDPGVAVYFARDGKGQCIPCDKWTTIADNTWAIAKTINALRGIERWGAKSMVDAAMQGFLALPAEAGGAEWWTILELPATASLDDINRAYFRKAKLHHPDAGGALEDWDRIRWAYDTGKAARSLV